MADENNQNNQNNEQSGSYYEPQAENTNQYSQPQQYYQVPQGENPFNCNMPPKEEKANVWLAILSFFIPIVGLVLYLTQKKDKPKTAKACGKAALACVIIDVIIGIISGIASVFIAKKALEDPAATDFLNDYSAYLEDYIEDNYSDAFIDDADVITADTLGGERMGYFTKPDGAWTMYQDANYDSDTMLGFTNNTEIITMAYYDGTGAEKEDIRTAVTASLESSAANTGVDTADAKTQQFSYDDFYAECEYISYADDYQLFMMFFQSDVTNDMIYFAVESADMDKAEFNQFVNQLVNSHTFVNQQLSVEF